MSSDDTSINPKLAGCPYHEVSISKLLPYFLDDPALRNEEITISPSKLKYEMEMSTEDRLEHLSRPTRKLRTHTPSENFSRTPDIIVFQNFEPGKTYNTTLILQNTQQISRHLMKIENLSPFFTTSTSTNNTSKLAPGMKYVVHVEFKPTEDRDYLYIITFVTEGETFTVPVYGIRGEPMLCMPDYIKLPKTAIRIASVESVVIHNVGRRSCIFVIECKEPFSVYPVRGCLQAKEIGELKIKCKTDEQSGKFFGELLYICNGVKIRIPIECEIDEALVLLNQNSLTFVETFMGLQDHQKVSVYNRSDYKLDFIWKKYKSYAIDQLEREKLLKSLEDVIDLEKTKCVKLQRMNVIDSTGHSDILQKNLEIDIETVEQDVELLYQSKIFSIIPERGHILPKQKMEFTIIFGPPKNVFYNDWAYLDVTGKNERFSLNLIGQGKGPEVVLNLKLLNINEIFMNARHEFQVIAKNSGYIPATLVFKAKRTNFGGVIKCAPRIRYLKYVDIAKPFIISFYSHVRGNFVETVEFYIQESREIIYFILKGNVVCPVLDVTIPNIDFGTVSFGTSITKKFPLQNNSQVAIAFKMTLKDLELEEDIDIVPREGIVEPYSEFPIEINLLAETIRVIDSFVIINMWEESEDNITHCIPLYYKALPPNITCSPDVLVMDFCFINYEYKRSLKFQNNDSNLHCTLKYTPDYDITELEITVNPEETEICESQQLDIELTVLPKVIGNIEYPLLFTLKGGAPNKFCTLICNVQGPVLSIDPEELDFGMVTLLKTTTRTLTLINDSPIPAAITLSVSPESHFTVDINEIEILPESNVTVTITCYLTYHGQHKEVLSIDVVNGEVLNVNILAEGVGHSILVEPTLDPVYNVGYLFTCQEFRLPVTLSNLGKRHYKLQFKNRTDFGERKLVTLKEIMEAQSLPSLFDIRPSYCELAPSDLIVAEIRGMSRKPKEVSEMCYCYSAKDKGSRATLIFSFTIKAVFLEPNIEFSESVLGFLMSDPYDITTFNAKKDKKFIEDDGMSCDDLEPFDLESVLEENAVTNDNQEIENDDDEYNSDDSIQKELEFVELESGITIKVDTDKSTKKSYCSSVVKNSVDIRNKTKLPVNLILNTSSGFYILDENCQKCTIYPVKIDVNESHTVVIQFSPEPEKKKIEKVSGAMRVDYINHPKTEILHLEGEIYYPTVEIPENLKFITVPPHSSCQKSFIIHNLTFLSTNYEWKFKNFEIEKLLELPSNILPRSPSASFLSLPDIFVQVDESTESLDSSLLQIQKSLKGFNKNPKLSTNSLRKPSEKSERSEKIIRTTRGILEDSDTISGDIDRNQWDKEKYELEITKIIKPLFQNDKEGDAKSFKCLMQKNEDDIYCCQNVFSIEPFKGNLQPYEYAVVNISFHPPPNTRVRATAQLIIDGGEVEEMTLSGVCSTISYKLDKDYVEYGRRIYNEVCESKITLTNTGYGAFCVMLFSDEVTNPIFGGWLNVSPKFKCLRRNEKLIMTVKYYPGFAGEFNKYFIMEIGYLEPLRIHIHGYATFCQVNLSLPRPIMVEYWKLAYKAISSLTDRFLLLFNTYGSENFPIYEQLDDKCPSGMNMDDYVNLQIEGWAIYSNYDLYPTIVDIELAVERELLNEYLTKTTRKSLHYLDFEVPEYLLDFGPIILDKSVCYTVLVLNYGPVQTEVRYSKHKSSRTLEQNDFKVELKAKKLDVGRLTEFYILFKPSKKVYGFVERKVEDYVMLSVKGGSYIKIIIKAIVTLPRISLTHTFIDFGDVLLGCAIRRSIVMKNEGYICSKWEAELERWGNVTKSDYCIMPEEGTIEPGNSALFDILFMPTSTGNLEALITIIVRGNVRKTILKLKGVGVEPTLLISSIYPKFKPTLPFCEDDGVICTISNVSDSPIEYTLPDFDGEYEDEKLYINAYLYYYNLDAVLIPKREPGTKLLDIFHGTYYYLLGRLRQKILYDRGDGEKENVDDPLGIYTPEEIFPMIKSYIDATNVEKDTTKTEDFKNEDQSLKISVIEKDRSSVDLLEERAGIVIIFYGGPYTNSYRAACIAGKVLNMPVYSIDRLITEALNENYTSAAHRVNEYINGLFEQAKFELEKKPYEDSYDELENKINAMLSGKLSRGAGTGSQKGKKGKSADKSTSTKSSKPGGKKVGISLEIPGEMIISLLKEIFERFTNGVIIESLNTKFLSSINIVLKTLLDALITVKYVHFVILHYAWRDFVNDEKEASAKRKEKSRSIVSIKEVKSLKSRTGSEKEQVPAKKERIRSVVSVKDSKSHARSGSIKSDKSSKQSKDKKGKKDKKDKETKELEALFKSCKKSFDDHFIFMNEILQICEFWDPQNMLMSKRRSTLALRSKSSKDLKPGKDGKSFSKAPIRRIKSSLGGVGSLGPSLKTLTPDTGMPILVANNANKEKPFSYYEAIALCIQHDAKYQEVLEQQIKVPPESTTNFTVFRTLKRKKRLIEDNFEITTVVQEQSVKQSTFDERYSVLSTSSMKTKKQKRLASRSCELTQSIHSKEFLVDYTFSPRTILNPGAFCRYKIKFKPKQFGIFQHPYTFEILGLNATQSIFCKATCEIPQLDYTPEHVYDKVVESSHYRSPYDNLIYVKDESTFYFGFILIGNHKTNSYCADLHLKNLSSLPCQVEATLDENSMFTCSPTEMQINIHSTENLKIFVKPTKRGTTKIRGSLYITVKSNPMVYTVKLQARACPMEFNFSPKFLTYEKVPLNYCSEKTVTLRNPSPIDLMWKLLAFDWAKESFHISPTSGFLKLYSVEEITFQYTPTQEEIFKKTVEIRVFDLNSSAIIPFLIDHITLNVESVEYIVEYDNHLQLGDIKGRTVHKLKFDINNTGKCNITLSVDDIENITEESRVTRKHFNLKTRQLVLLPGKIGSVLFTFEPTRELELVEYPVYVCNFLDTNKEEDNIIKSFFIYVSARVHLSKFEICPSNNLNFGHQLLKSKTTQILEITNTGRFDFKFRIKQLKAVVRLHSKGKKKEKKFGSTSDNKSSKSTKSNKSSKGTTPKQKEKITKLVIPGFTIFPEKGDIRPGTTTEIHVECTPLEYKDQKETIVIEISEPPKEYLLGKQVSLHVTGAEPLLDFENFTKIFKECFICDKLDNFIPSKSVEDYCVFVTSVQTLYFSRVYVNNKKVATICITNIGHVPAETTMKIKEKDGLFNVTPTEAVIPPAEYEAVKISFTPIAIGTFENVLEISYASSVNNTLVIHLSGDSCVPRITLLEPEPDEYNKCLIEFPLTYVTETTSSSIKVQNIGEIPCKVIIGLHNGNCGNFNLEVCENTVKFLNLDQPEFKLTKHSTLINLKPGEIGAFNLHFSPLQEAINDMEVIIYIVNNPFEIFKIHVVGKSFRSELVIQGLQAYSSNDDRIYYELDFGYTILNSLQIKNFTLVNFSNDHIYKFEFSKAKKMLIIPRVGHIKPNSKKEVIATFSSRVPTVIEKFKIEFKYILIEYTDECLTGLSWDERQEITKPFSETDRPASDFTLRRQSKSYFMESVFNLTNSLIAPELQFEEGRASLATRLLEKREPKYKYLNTAWEIIPILFSVAADFAQYTCTTSQIVFQETIVKESSVESFTVENNGLRPLQIEWTIQSDKILSSMRQSIASTGPSSEKELSIQSASYTSLDSVSLTKKEDLVPFQIHPERTRVPPNEERTFKLLFTPKEMATYTGILTSTIQSLHPNCKEMAIAIEGKSTVPNFYFEIEDNGHSYLTKGKAKDPNIQIITFVAIGIGTVCRSKFCLVNNYPHPVSFKFDTMNLKGVHSFTCFSCKTLAGKVTGLKKFEIIVNFHPQDLGVFEEKCLFSLNEHDYEATVLLIGECREPKVSFATAHVSMHPTVPTMNSKEQILLRNDENVELEYKFSKKSLMCDQNEDELKIDPPYGKLKPKSETPLQLTYCSTKLGVADFFIKCAVHRMKEPLTLNVTAYCKEIIASVYYLRSNNRTDLKPDQDNFINFGVLPVRKKTVYHLIIENNGDTGFFYNWSYNKKALEHAFEITAEEREVFIPSLSKGKSSLGVTPLKKTSLRNFKVVLQISYGKKYTLKISATAKTTFCKFSFSTYDFGYCIVQPQFSKEYVALLELRNYDTAPLMFESAFEDTRDLSLEVKSATIPIHATKILPIYFHPQKVGTYNFNVLLQVNSHNYCIKIRGQAVRVNVQLFNITDKFIDLGKVKVGATKQAIIEVINRTPTRLPTIFDLCENLPIQAKANETLAHDMKLPESAEKKKPVKTGKEKISKSSLSFKVSEKSSKVTEKVKKNGRNKRNSSKGSIVNEIPKVQLQLKKSLKEFIKIKPNMINMEPNKKYELTVEFNGKEKLPSFSEKIYYQVYDQVQPLCQIKGGCSSLSLALDKDIVTFSNVVVGYKRSNTVLLINSGDLDATFKWTFEEPTNVFSIEPDSGFVRHRTHKRFNVQFSPKTVVCQFTNKIKCVIENHRTLELLLIGNSLDIPKPTETLIFQCPVRDSTTRFVTMHNPTKVPFRVKAVVHTMNFEVPCVFEIPPETSSPLEVTYHPKKMTYEIADEDQLYLETADGRLEIYNLIGKTTPPLPIGRINIDTYCKQNHCEILTIENSMNAKQSFKVTTKLTSEITSKTIYKVHGIQTLEVLGHNCKDYRWNIYVVNEGVLEFQVTFTDILSNEYMFYEIYMNVLPSNVPTEIITLKASIRELVTGVVKLMNPINVPVNYTITCGSTDIQVGKEATVKPYSTFNVPISYYPLVSGEFTAILEANCEELGKYFYEIVMTVKSPQIEDVVYFNAELGDRCVKSVDVRNVLNTAVELTAKFEHSVFTMEKPLTILPEQTGKFIIAFEPNQLGKIKSSGTLFSPLTGEYHYAFTACGNSPTPKGPFFVKPGGFTPIHFINPFQEQCTFVYNLDSKYFFLKDHSEVIHSKKSTKIMVGLMNLRTFNEEIKYPLTGRITVKCEDKESLQDIRWVFYIQNE